MLDSDPPVSEMLRDIQAATDLPAEEIADKLNVSRQTFYNWRSGSSPRSGALPRLRRFWLQSTSPFGSPSQASGFVAFPTALIEAGINLDTNTRRLVAAAGVELRAPEDRDQIFWEDLINALVIYPNLFVGHDQSR